MAVRTLTADVAVVGAGVAGSLVAWQLARSGARVVLLDSGPRVSRDEAVQRFREASAKVPESPYPSSPWAPRPSVLDIPGDLSAGPVDTGYLVQAGPDPFGSTYERVVGGTTWHWLGSVPRLLPNDFRMRTVYGVGVDWPISYADLAPWYVRAERALGVAGDPAHPLGAPRAGAGYPMRPIPQSYLDSVFARATASLGLPVEPTPQARNSEGYDDRPRCCGASNCIPVCPVGAKYDGSVHARKAEAAGALVLPNAVAHDLVVSGGRVTAVLFREVVPAPDGSIGSVVESRVDASLVVVAAHGIETPKLLLMSNGGRGVANSSDQVGRNLMDHPIKLSYAVSREPVFPQRGPLSTSGIETLRDGPSVPRGRRSAFRIEIGNDGWRFPIGDPTDVVANGDRARGPVFIAPGAGGPALRQAWVAHSQREVRMASLTEMLPDPANRVVPSPTHTDALGLPRPLVSFRVGAYTHAGLDEAQAVHDRVFDALGVTERHHVPFPFGAGHIMGTYRMGTDRATSVVDRDCRSHDLPNLFLVGSGTFPTTGTGNPTLTLSALALRAADAMIRTR